MSPERFSAPYQLPDLSGAEEFVVASSNYFAMLGAPPRYEDCQVSFLAVES